MTEFEKAAVRSALRKMFQPDSFFSICVFKELAIVTGAIVPQRTMQALDLLHCVHWREMEPGQPEKVMATVLEALSLPGFDFLEEGIERVSEGKGIFSRLLKT